MVAQCCECTKNHWIVFSPLKESKVCKLYRVKEKFPCSAWLGEVLRKLWNTIKWYLADKMHIEGTPNTHEMSKHYSFFWFFFFFLEHPLCTNRQNRVTLGDGSSNKLITLPRKRFTAVSLKLLLTGLKFGPSFTFDVFISLCVHRYLPICSPHLPKSPSCIHVSIPPSDHCRLPASLARLLWWSLIGFPTPLVASVLYQMNLFKILISLNPSSGFLICWGWHPNSSGDS